MSTDAAAVKALVQSTITDYGRLDIVFNNAGIGCLAMCASFPSEQWRTIF